MPWGQGMKWGNTTPKANAPGVNPNTYDYPKVGEPPDTEEGWKIRALIEKYAKEYNVPVQLMFNKAHVETGGTWNPNAYNNSSGASGLFQLMPDTANRLGVKDPFNLDDNIRGATDLMSQLLKRTNGDPFLAEIGYNSRPKNISSEAPLPYETYYHLQKVFPGQQQDYLWQRMPTNTVTNPFLFWREAFNK